MGDGVSGEDRIVSNISKRLAKALGWMDLNAAGNLGRRNANAFDARGEPLYERVPDYEIDATAGLAELARIGCQWTLTYGQRYIDDPVIIDLPAPDILPYRCVITTTKSQVIWGSRGATPALAICAALDAYYERSQS